MNEDEITRFDMDMDGSMEPSEHGEWVRYSDVHTSPQPQPQKPLTDEQIQNIVIDASHAGMLSWVGYKKDNEGKYTIPVLSPSDYQFARAIEAAHGIKE